MDGLLSCPEGPKAGFAFDKPGASLAKELPKTEVGGGPAGVKDCAVKPVGGGPAGVVDGPSILLARRESGVDGTRNIV